MRSPRLIAALAPIAVAAMGCHAGGSSEQRAGPPPAASAPAPRAPAPPPTPVQPVTFSTSDGAALAGDLYLAADHSAPSLVLVHRQFRDRSEWKSLVEALRVADKRFTILAFDLRGEGASKRPPKEKIEDGPSHMREDVRAAIGKVLEATGGASRGVVLAGSSLGAALVAQVAFDEPKVVALALISPGMDIAGQDGLHPYADVRNLPTFVAAGDEDNVAEEPVRLLANMALAATIKRYPGKARGADSLGSDAPLVADLETWLASVYDAKPVERKPAYHQGGKREARR